MMKKLLIGLVVTLVCMVGIPKSEAITRIVGLSSECDTTLSGCNPTPSTITLLGDGPFLSQPSLTDSTRFWGSLPIVSDCRTSTGTGKFGKIC